MIHNHDMDVMAVVSYDVGDVKNVDFYSNNE